MYLQPTEYLSQSQQNSQIDGYSEIIDGTKTDIFCKNLMYFKADYVIYRVNKRWSLNQSSILNSRREKHISPMEFNVLYSTIDG